MGFEAKVVLKKHYGGVGGGRPFITRWPAFVLVSGGGLFVRTEHRRGEEGPGVLVPGLPYDTCVGT